jgi:hypothetical protein
MMTCDGMILPLSLRVLLLSIADAKMGFICSANTTVIKSCSVRGVIVM